MEIELSRYIEAGCPALYLRTLEEERALSLLVKSLQKAGLSHLRIMVWKPTTGLCTYGADSRTEGLRRDIVDVLSYVEWAPEVNGPRSDTVYVFFRTHFYFKRPEVVQAFRDAVWAVRRAGSHLVLIGPWADFPPEIQEILTVVDIDLPDEGTLHTLFDKMISVYGNLLEESPEDAVVRAAASAARGLSLFRAENAAALSLVGTRTLDPKVFYEEKHRMLKTFEALEYLPSGRGFSELGGFSALKAHVGFRGLYFKDPEKARRAGLIRPPRGVLLIGLPGTGKTLSARCIAGELGIPLYRFNLGSLFRSYVGESEATTLRLIRTIEAAAPAVLLIDEFEKAFSGLDSSGRSDSGVTSRVIAMLLSWMQDCEQPVYRVATANSLRNLDSAMLRLGRWDAVFSVDLPSAKERGEIFRIHLEKRGYSVDDVHLPTLLRLSDGFSGSEIEAAVEDALYRALSLDIRMDTHLLSEALKEVVPLSVTDAEEIEEFRLWINGRARSVSSE